MVILGTETHRSARSISTPSGAKRTGSELAPHRCRGRARPPGAPHKTDRPCCIAPKTTCMQCWRHVSMRLREALRMGISFKCEMCGQDIVIDEAGAGQVFDCPKCSTPLLVPSKSVEAEPSAGPGERGTRTNFHALAWVLGFLAVATIGAGLIVWRGTRPATISGAAWVTLRSGQSDLLRGLEVTLLTDEAINAVQTLPGTTNAPPGSFFGFFSANGLFGPKVGEVNIATSDWLRQLWIDRFFQELDKKLVPHVVRITKTDVDAKYEIREVPRGVFVVYAKYKTEFSAAYWLVRVVAAPGRTIKVDLDNSNMRDTWPPYGS